MDSEETYIKQEESQGNMINQKWFFSSKKALLISIPLLIILAVSLAAFLFYRQQQIQKEEQLKQVKVFPTIPFPSPTPDRTADWQTLSNTNGFKLKYPANAKILPSLSEATSSSRIQIIATDSATLIVEVLDQNNLTVKDKPLLDIVNLIRDKNKDQQILTKPISILIAGYEGYEWYFTGDKFITITQTLSIKDAKNRVIQFNKNNTHYIILSTFDEGGEQLLSTLNINQ